MLNLLIFIKNKLVKVTRFLFIIGNEWKTRFENQEEINRQLEKQIAGLEKKLDETKNMSKNGKIYC